MRLFLRQTLLSLALPVALCLPVSQSLALNIVTEDVTSLVGVNPGVYGIEVRGGRPRAADWELGVGVQTSQNNPRTFNQAEIDWGNGPYDFEFVWSSNEVSATIGGVTRSWQDNWQIGNAIRIGVSGRDGFTDFAINTLDGLGVSGTPLFSFNRSNEGYQNYFIAGDDLANGWTMTGTIDMTGGGGSRRLLHITTAQHSPTTEVPVPATFSLFGLGVVGLLIGRRRQN